MRFRLLLIAAVMINLPVVVGAQLIDPHEFPFGPYSGLHHASDTVFYSDEVLEFMHDSLGYNQFTSGGIDENTAGRLVSHGIYSYPWGAFAAWPRWIIEPQTKYAGVEYFVCQAESTTGYFNVRFKQRQGWVCQDSLWAWNGAGVMLGELRFGQAIRYDWLDPFNDFQYSPYLKIAVDSTTKSDSLATDTMLVGVFEAWAHHWPEDDELRFADSIYAGDLPYGRDTLLALVDDRTGHDPNPYYTLNEGDWHMLFQLKKTAPGCTLSVDYFKVHSQEGVELIEENQYANVIKQSAGREGYRGKILGWFIKDRVYAGNMRPFAYIDSLIRDTTRVWGADSVQAAGHVILLSGTGFWSANDGYRDFVRHTHPRVMWSFLYPIGLNVAYTGYSDDVNVALQKDLEFYLTVPCDSIRSALAGQPGSSWMYVPQYWYCDPDDPDFPCTTNQEVRRKPTEAEMRAMTYIGLCYHPAGIVFYKYDSSAGAIGMINPDGDPTAGMYDVVKEDINPYIKAIDEYYMGLEWERAYPYKNGICGVPGSAYIHNIWSASIIGGLINESDPNINPDRGWFHVGEYEDSIGVPYIMLVNRACSQGPKDPTEAPSISASITLNHDNLNLGHNLYVIDLAQAVYYEKSKKEWIAIPDTTHIAFGRNENPSFTIGLRAGEGRLFKIVKAQ